MTGIMEAWTDACEQTGMDPSVVDGLAGVGGVCLVALECLWWVGVAYLARRRLMKTTEEVSA